MNKNTTSQRISLEYRRICYKNSVYVHPVPGGHLAEAISHQDEYAGRAGNGMLSVGGD